MPVLPPVPNSLRIDIAFAIGTAPALVRLHYSYTGGPPSAADCLTIANAVGTAFNANLRANMQASTSQTTITVTDIASASGASNVGANNAAGTEAGAALPAGVAVLVNYKVARRYRGGKPRTYWPFFTQADVGSANGWATASVTRLQAAIAAFNTAIVGTTAGTTVISAQTNVSYFSGFTAVQNPVTRRYRNIPNLRAGGPVQEAITSRTVNPIQASQRRRNRHSV